MTSTDIAEKMVPLDVQSLDLIISKFYPTHYLHQAARRAKELKRQNASLPHITAQDQF